MSGAGGGLVFDAISAIISIIDTTRNVYEAVEDDAGLPTNFKKSAMKLPLILKLLEHAEEYVNNETDESIKDAFTPTLEDCKVQAIQLQGLFETVIPGEADSRWDRYMKAARTIGKRGRVESLVGGILDDLQLLSTRFPGVTTPREDNQLAMAIEEVTRMEPSLPDGFEQTPTYAYYGSGAQNIHLGRGNQYSNGPGNQLNGPGNQYIGTNYIVNNHKMATPDDIDRSCLRSLRCPDTLAVKNRLKENKDKLLPKSIDWILQNPKYISWKDGEDVCLLWIKGGAGKGKTMISIGLIEQLSRPQDESTMVTYFFCQEANYELKTLEAIIKGLILQLVTQQKDLKESLRRRWDAINERFDEDVTSWRTLWNIFSEMLSRCKCLRVYVIVDALDECQDDAMADFLKLIVRTGLDQPSKIKWLLTSRPLDSAERELLAGPDQVELSLELNQKQLSKVVKTFIASKVIELDRRQHYGLALRQKVESELAAKAEDTMLWVSLVCRRLESVHRDMALTTIQDLPPDLPDFYRRVFNQLNEGESAVVKGCMRLLKAMMLAYRPLNVAEVGSVTGLSEQLLAIEVWVDRCASFVKRRGTEIEFVHQSARDYLAGKDGQSIFDSSEHYGHGEIALNCISHLTKRLKVNLVGLSQPDSTRESIDKNALAVVSVDYAASFWVQHLDLVKETTLIQNALTEQGEVGTFLRTKFLEWLECLSLFDRLPSAIEMLSTLTDMLKKNPLLSIFTQDATRFLLRHYRIIATWPLQIYSSAVVFSPQKSVVRTNNLDKLPIWLGKLQVEDSWASLIQTFAGHLMSVTAIAFSPDGKQIASGSMDNTIKLWDARTGSIQKTLTGHSDMVVAVAFSPDSKQIISGSWDKAIKLWDARTGIIQKTLKDHLKKVTTIAFSQDGKQIASGSEDNTIKLWNTRGNIQKTLKDHSSSVYSIAFSPDSKQIISTSAENTITLWDIRTGSIQKTIIGHSSLLFAIAFSQDGKQIASGSKDQTIKLWDARTGNLQKTLIGHSSSVYAIAFSPDNKQIASGSADNTIKLWDTRTGNLQKTLIGHLDRVMAIAFSPDSKQIISGSWDKTIKLWDIRTDSVQKTLPCHSSLVLTIVFSPDSKQIASGSWDNTIKLWDARTGNFQKMLIGHSSYIFTIAFSPDSKQIASGSADNTIKLWDTETGNLQKTLIGHSDTPMAIAFSPDNKQIASGSADHTIKLWDTRTGNLQKTLKGHLGMVGVVAFSPDSKQIASGSEDWTIKLWDSRTGSLQKTLAGHSSSCWLIAFSPDGKQIASGSADNIVKLWDIAKSLKVSKLLGSTLGSHFRYFARREIKNSKPISSLKFSANGRHLMTNFGQIKIESFLANTPRFGFESSENLSVYNQWIYYGAMPIFCLPLDFKVECHDSIGDQLGIGFISKQTSQHASSCSPTSTARESEKFNRTAIKKGPAVVLGDGAGIWDAFHILNLAPLYELLLAKALADKRSRLASKGYISRGQEITRGNSYYKAWQASSPGLVLNSVVSLGGLRRGRREI
ncbi:hypothetical protein V495_07752 [Pseudogymnoascus sp. VKM F-4514 (FW-929)]|nr:hypothetical protein V495_07752 [Pseudogymnoascus sp. VKM F-4514 (FW-929)]KFY54625.1 hypothetical protein V497_07553 [Pseudogymnoascus sp. VKM F-4516 (FW-969)]